MRGQPAKLHKSLWRRTGDGFLPHWALRKGILQVKRSLGNNAGLKSQLTCTHGSPSCAGPGGQGRSPPGGWEGGNKGKASRASG